MGDRCRGCGGGHQGFDPSESTQIQAYPGEFIGLGSVDETADGVDLAIPADLLSVSINV